MLRHRPFLFGSFGLFGVSALLGCGPGMVDPDYPGEPLAQLHGVVTNPLEAEIDGTLQACVGWMPNLEKTDEFMLIDQVAFEGEFPAAFNLTVYEPPPEDAVMPNDISLGAVFVMSEAALDETVANDFIIPEGALVGVTGAFLLHTPIAIAEARDVDIPYIVELRGPLAAGFNLVLVRSELKEQCLQTESAAYSECLDQAGCDDLTQDEFVACRDAACGDPDAMYETCPSAFQVVPLDTELEVALEIFDHGIIVD